MVTERTQINIRLHSEELELFRDAAKKSGKTLSAFMREPALAIAKATIEIIEEARKLIITNGPSPEP